MTRRGTPESSRRCVASNTANWFAPTRGSCWLLHHLNGYNRAQLTWLVSHWLGAKPLVKNYRRQEHAFVRRVNCGSATSLQCVNFRSASASLINQKMLRLRGTVDALGLRASWRPAQPAKPRCQRGPLDSLKARSPPARCFAVVGTIRVHPFDASSAAPLDCWLGVDD